MASVSDETTIFFSIHAISSTNILADLHASSTPAEIISKLFAPSEDDWLGQSLYLLQQHLWANETFQDHLRVVEHSLLSTSSSTTSEGYTTAAVAEVLHIEGKMDYGGCVTDAWLAVFLLWDTCRRHKSLCARIEDDLGEMLLVEAESVLPKYCDPSNSMHRVWLSGYGVLVLPVEPPRQEFASFWPSPVAVRDPKRIGNGGLPANSALKVLRSIANNESEAIGILINKAVSMTIRRRVLKAIEEAKMLHRTALVLPYSVAYLLQEQPRVAHLALQCLRNMDVTEATSHLQKNGCQYIDPCEEVVKVITPLSRYSFALGFFAPLPGVLAPPPASQERTTLPLTMGSKVTMGIELLLCFGGEGDTTPLRESIKALLSSAAQEHPPLHNVCPAHSLGDSIEWMDEYRRAAEREEEEIGEQMSEWAQAMFKGEDMFDCDSDDNDEKKKKPESAPKAKDMVCKEDSESSSSDSSSCPSEDSWTKEALELLEGAIGTQGELTEEMISEMPEEAVEAFRVLAHQRKVNKSL